MDGSETEEKERQNSEARETQHRDFSASAGGVRRVRREIEIDQ